MSDVDVGRLPFNSCSAYFTLSFGGSLHTMLRGALVKLIAACPGLKKASKYLSHIKSFKFSILKR